MYVNSEYMIEEISFLLIQEKAIFKPVLKIKPYFCVGTLEYIFSYLKSYMILIIPKKIQSTPSFNIA